MLAETGVSVGTRARSWIGVSVGGALVLLFALIPAAPARQTAPAEMPNVLLVVTDDQRVGTLDAMPATVNFFRIKGRKYTNAFATSPLCCPSRASIMTGRYPHNHGVQRNEEADKLDQTTTLQYYLQQAGYHTALVGKYLNGWPEAETAPPHFDRWAAIEDASYANVYFDFVANVDGTVRQPRGYSTDFIADKSLDFLDDFETDDQRPWFLYVAPFASHKPFAPERRYRDANTPYWPGNPAVTEDDRSDKPEWVQRRNVSLRHGRSIGAKQQRTLLSVDDMIAAITRRLTRLDEARDTIAIFTSDNGYMWGEHGVASKRFPYTAATKIPLIVRWPGRVEPASSDDRLAANIDIAPTVLEAIGIEVTADEPMDGRSLFAEAQRDRLLMEYFGARLGETPPWASVRSNTHQYVEYYTDNAAETVLFREYYDLASDPFQLVNLYGDADPTNDPNVLLQSADLLFVRDCAGDSCP